MLKHFAALDELEGLVTPVVLATVNPVFYNDATLAMVRYLLQKGMRGVYLSLNKPVAALRQSFQPYQPEGALIFVDAITAGRERETEDCIYLGPNQELSNLGIAVAKALAKLNTRGFLIVDSLSTLLVYNEERSVAKFAHLLTEKLRANSIYGVLLTVQSSSEHDLISRLAQFVDRLVHFGEELPR